MEWRPDVDGKMGKDYVSLKQLILCSLLTLIGVTEHDSGAADLAKAACLNISVF